MKYRLCKLEEKDLTDVVNQKCYRKRLLHIIRLRREVRVFFFPGGRSRSNSRCAISLWLAEALCVVAQEYPQLRSI